MDTIRCKAASADNKFEINELIELFRAVYGDSYPLSSVYDAQFWHRHIGQRFTSVLVYRGRNLVGHLAVQPEGSDGKMVQVIFPLCHPRACDQIDEISDAAWSIFETQAVRQQWTGIYFFAFADVPQMVRFGERVLKVKSTALCPAYFPPSNLRLVGTRPSAVSRRARASERTDIVIGQRFFNPRADKRRSIYINPEHRELVERLYQTLELPRDVKIAAEKGKLESYPLPADRSAIETHSYSKSSIMHAYIEPSLIRSDAELAERFLKPRSDSTFIFVKAYDPKALDVIAWLESNDYEFSGILPFVHDRESLLFSHTNSESSMRDYDTESLLLGSTAQ